MKILIHWSLLIFGLLIIGASKSQDPVNRKRPTPYKILQSVKERYHSYNKLEVKARKTLDIKVTSPVSKHHKAGHSFIYFASEPMGEIRFASKRKDGQRLIISNGKAVWDYSSRLNAYTKKKPSFSQSAKDHIENEFKGMSIYNYVKNFARAFNPLADSIKKVTGPGQDTIIMPDSSRRKVLKINITYAQDSLFFAGLLKGFKANPSFSVINIENSPVTFWIDPNIPVVLRESFGGSFEVKKSTTNSGFTMKFAMRQDIYFTSVNLHPTFSDTTFVFHPPEGAKRVKKLKASKK